MKTVAFVPVRLTSSRLPKKHLKKIGDRTLLSWVIKRLKDAQVINQIVVCAPDENGSEQLIEFCEEENVEIYLYDGNIEDVVGRLTSAAKIYDAEICVLASGDCPLHSDKTVKLLVELLQNDVSKDIARLTSYKKRSPIHEGLLVMRRVVWEYADSISDSPELREHLFPIIALKQNLFSKFSVVSCLDFPEFYSVKHRISIDTVSDLEFHLELNELLIAKKREYNLSNVIKVLHENDSVIEINNHVKQKGLENKGRKVLFFVSSISEYGYGNLIRSIDIARCLIDDYGLGIEFCVLDSIALIFLEREHFLGVVFTNWLDFSRNMNFYDVVVFDVNKELIIEDSHFLDVMSKKNCIVIDNVQPWTRRAKKIVIPTAHYLGPKYDNLMEGYEYAVIRRAVRKIRLRQSTKKEQILVYMSDDRLHLQYEDMLSKLPKKEKKYKILWVHSYSDQYIQVLSESKRFLSVLGISAYEALYLSTEVSIVPTGNESDILQFKKFASSAAVSTLGSGSRNLASVINELANSVSSAHA